MFFSDSVWFLMRRGNYDRLSSGICLDNRARVPSALQRALVAAASDIQNEISR